MDLPSEHFALQNRKTTSGSNGRLIDICLRIVEPWHSEEFKERYSRLHGVSYADLSDEDYVWCCGAEELQAAKAYAARRLVILQKRAQQKAARANGRAID